MFMRKQEVFVDYKSLCQKLIQIMAIEMYQRLADKTVCEGKRL
jgi:hypothetical protein